MKKFRLTENMRARFHLLFSKFLLRVGNGTEKTIQADKILIPKSMVIPNTDDMT